MKIAYSLLYFFLFSAGWLMASTPAQAVQPPAVPASTPLNAMWSNENTYLIMWIYQESAKCPETRRSAKSVLIASPNRRLQDREWSESIPAELPLCVERTWNGAVSTCSNAADGGVFRLQYFEAEQEYRGEYRFKMSDGTEKSGIFRAQYCPLGS